MLDALPGGGTRIEFEHAWRTAARSERLLAPLARTLLRGGLRTAMQRLAAQLEQHDGARSAA